MKPLLIIQLRPEDTTAENEYEAILHHGGLTATQTERLRLESTPLPNDFDATNYCAIIVGGSPFDISTPAEEKSAVQQRVEADFTRLFNQIVPADIPFLGACSGNGLLGNYLGASITTTYGEPVGGVDITLTEAGKTDPLLAGAPSTFRALVGHKEACDDVPPDAILLASSATCPVQMFRVGENVYATQFHPEGDAAGFTVRINTYKHHGYFPADEADALIERINQEETPYSHAVLKNFVARYQQ